MSGKSTRLRALVEAGNSIVAPGAFDGLSAQIIEQAGFESVYASGGAIARSSGVPDLGLLSLAEVVARLETMVDAVDLPVIADADAGYGNALNVRRAVRAFRRVGVAALHLEDQREPKRCGHYDDKHLIAADEMCQKMRAARDEAGDDLYLIARTDAIAVEGFSAAIDRSHLYMEAGADMVFVEAPVSVEQVEEIARLLPYPKLVNMFWGGKTPLMPASRLAELGYAIVIIPGDLQRAAITAMKEVLRTILEDGHSGSFQDRMATYKEREDLVRTAHYLALGSRYASGDPTTA
ncbi:MAG: oxaloacetate decarboxylase [Rhizobiaceae bacterium]